MAATMTLQQLQNGLKAVEEDLDSFIKSQKNNLRREKDHLGAQRGNSAGNETPRIPSNTTATIKKKVDVVPDGNGLNLGGYEIKQGKLREERQREYKQYLEQKSKRGQNGGNGVTNDEQWMNAKASSDNRNHMKSPAQSGREYKAAIDKEYSNMVEKKRNEESLYRVKYDTANDIEYEPAHNRQKTGKKVIEFDDSDDELFKYVLQEKEKSRGQRKQVAGSASGKTRPNDGASDGRSSSVPPPKVPYIFGGSSHAHIRNKRNREHKDALEQQMKENELSKENESNHDGLSAPSRMPYVFGGSSHSMMRKQRNIEHKQALEEQIKEKEEIRVKEKLRRMGKITESSNSKSNQVPSNAEFVVNTILKSDAKSAPLHQPSNYNLGNKTENVLQSSLLQGNLPNGNMNSGYPVQNGYGVNPMYNQMMMYPVGWPGYGGPMMPNNYVPRNMVPFPQQVADMPLVDTNKNNYQGNERAIESYVPSAIDKMNTVKTSIKMQSSGISFGGAANEPDNNKRAQQIAYQNELKEQMEMKKAAAEKEKRELERYELKLEKEIATYDPWGKSGAGAPVRNKDGTIIADLRKVLQDKDNRASLDLGKVPDDVSPLMKAMEMSPNNDDFTKNDNIPPIDTSPSHKRGAFTKELQGLKISPGDKAEQNSYKAFLQEQVEAKKRKEEEIKEKARLEEEKENKRLAQQQQQMREEYEAEKEKQRRKAEEIRQENEARALIAEQKKIEEDRKIREIEDERDADRKLEAEMKLTQNKGSTEDETAVPARSKSPIVPALVQKERGVTVHDVVERENNVTVQNANNKKADVNDRQKEMEGQENLIRQLSALRKQLMLQEEKVQSDLKKNKKEYSNLVSTTGWDDNHKMNRKSAFDRATSATYGRKRDTGRVSTLEQLMYDNKYDKEQIDLDTQQQEYMKQQEMRLLALRQGVENSTLPSDLRMNRQASKLSLLESESKFFSVDSNKITGNNIHGFSHKNKQSETGNNLLTAVVEPDATDRLSTVPSISSTLVEGIAHKNEERLANLTEADTAHKNKERLNKLKEDERSLVNTEANEENEIIYDDFR